MWLVCLFDGEYVGSMCIGCVGFVYRRVGCVYYCIYVGYVLFMVYECGVYEECIYCVVCIKTRYDWNLYLWNESM